MNLTVVIPAAHNPELTIRVSSLAHRLTKLNTDVIVWDNGVGISTRLGDQTNVGNYAVFHRAAAELESELVLFIHNDLVIHEKGYDERIVHAFLQDPDLAVLGFVGSDEFDVLAGRGMYAWSNYQGTEPGTSPAEAHGYRIEGYRPAANLDGCALAFRREMLLGLEERDWPPHHFYDRLFCLQALEKGHHVGYLGIACDHLNGQTANVFGGYRDLARRWCQERGIFHPVEGTGQDPNNWDWQVYREGETRILSEWFDEKRFIPLKVGADHEVYHLHPQGRAA